MRISKHARKLSRWISFALRLSPFRDGILRIVCTHHRMGSALFSNILSDIREEFGIRYYRGSSSGRPGNTDVWLQIHSQVEVNKTKGPYRGVHIVRHPYQVICSAYEYHKICDERWCVDADKPTQANGVAYDFGGLSYQQHLNSISMDDGLLVEIEGRSYDAILDMYNWDYAAPNFINVRFEDILSDYDAQMRRIYSHLCFSAFGMNRLLEISGRHNIDTWGQDRLMKNSHISNKKREQLTYREILKPQHYELIDAIYPRDLLRRLGY